MKTRRNAGRSQQTVRPLTRRQWLGAAAASSVAGPLAACAGARCAADDTAPAKAAGRRVAEPIELGVHTGPYTSLPLAEAVARIRGDGFTCVLTEYTFADVRFDPLAPDWKAADKIVRAFHENGIRIVAAFGYVNVVDPIPQRRKRGEARMDCLIGNWKRLGCANISTETGTFNTTSDWADAPENTTEEGYRKCRAALERLARKAEKAGAVVSIEPYWRNIIDSVDRVERLFREIQSPGLRLIMDPCNYPRKEDLPRQGAMLDDMFRRLGDKIVVAHAKDVKPAAEGTDLPAAGRGVLDYPRYLRLLAALGRPMPLLLEHLALDDVRRARDFVRGHMRNV